MSPRSEEQNALIKDERREQILSAALRVFASRGFSGTKISDIVAAGGTSHGLVYHYFRSKEEIFFELVSRAVFHAGQALLTVDAMPLGPLEKVRQTAKYILQGIDDGDESSYYFLIVIHAAVMESKEQARRYMEGSQLPMQVMANILAEGQKTGEIGEQDVREMSIAFFSAILGIALYKLSMPDFKMPDPEILVNMVKKH